MTRDDGRKYCAEFIGTFTLVIFAAGAVVVDGLTGGGLGMVGAGNMTEGVNHHGDHQAG